MVFKPLVAFISCDDCGISADVQWPKVAPNPRALVGVVPMAPLMNHKASFCTLTNVARCVCACVRAYVRVCGCCCAGGMLGAALLYFRVGLTNSPIPSKDLNVGYN